jgi:aldehyde dehydrogenase (NAD+)
VVQELGGKSPNVFLPDADFASAVPKGVLGMMRNVGQSCASPTRMVVPAARCAEVEALAADAANAIVVGDRSTRRPCSARSPTRRSSPRCRS